MSRKSRKRSKQAARPGTGVPSEEVLAEGSGPVAVNEAAAEAGVTVEAVAHVGVDEIAGDPQDANELVAAADEVGRRRRKRTRKPDVEAVETTEAASVEVTEVEVEVEAADAVDTAVIEAVTGDASLDEVLASDEPEDAAAAVEDPAGVMLAPEPAAEAIDGVEAMDGDAGDPGDPDGVVVESDDESDLSDPGADIAAALPTSAASMDAGQLKHLVEALVFASDKPITVARLRQLTRVSDTRRLEQALAELAEDFRDRGLVLQQVSGGYQFRTRTQFSVWVQQLIAGRPVRLSRAQLETLAIIAYRQPITRPEIDDIRGVDSSATLKLLIDRQLIRILGKREEVGRPMLYGTTKEFLDFFSLGDLRELPTLREYSELTDESRRVMSDRLGVELDPDTGGGDGGDGGDGGAMPGGGFESGGGDGGAGDASVGAAPDPDREAIEAYLADLAGPGDAGPRDEPGAPATDVMEAEAEVTVEATDAVEAAAGSTDEVADESADALEVDAAAEAMDMTAVDAAAEATDEVAVEASVGATDEDEVEAAAAAMDEVAIEAAADVAIEAAADVAFDAAVESTDEAAADVAIDAAADATDVVEAAEAMDDVVVEAAAEASDESPVEQAEAVGFLFSPAPDTGDDAFDDDALDADGLDPADDPLIAAEARDLRDPGTDIGSPVE